MNKKVINIILTSIVSIIAIGIIAFMIIRQNTQKEAKQEGTITIEYQNVDGNTIKSKEVVFYEGDTFVGLLKENFDNVEICETGVYSGMLTSIEDFTTPDDWSSFIIIYVNDTMYNYGINRLDLVDGIKVVLKVDIFDPFYKD